MTDGTTAHSWSSRLGPSAMSQVSLSREAMPPTSPTPPAAVAAQRRFSRRTCLAHSLWSWRPDRLWQARQFTSAWPETLQRASGWASTSVRRRFGRPAAGQVSAEEQGEVPGRQADRGGIERCPATSGSDSGRIGPRLRIDLEPGLARPAALRPRSWRRNASPTGSCRNRGRGRR
ncbi:MAG: hypothetical protein MZV64_33875 [Ignavibacteriales bacterium]|nr:hypothetical protein [Ignavibacteriales bacterium]